jgi:hypothetical protein
MQKLRMWYSKVSHDVDDDDGVVMVVVLMVLMY